ncbi:hypothetical protein [Magnetospirillum fulvum]|uniref:hypothetical protein n=1 Tax=Magnetospirillum fulvum TaxID=1082 RepID=UPI00147D1141|nr:hypothetical protein [Magnetospirillum fulvum]
MAAFNPGAASHSLCIVEAEISALFEAKWTMIGCVGRSMAGAAWGGCGGSGAGGGGAATTGAGDALLS